MVQSIKKTSTIRAMNTLRYAVWCSFTLTGIIWAQEPRAFNYQVTRAKPLAHTKLQHDERGRLQFSETGMLYRSENGKTTLGLPYLDVKEADVSDPRKIRIETYDIRALNPTKRRTYEFRTTEDHGPELTRFLARHIQRPVLGDSGASKADFNLPAYHRHFAGGAHGVLEIGSAGVRFVTKAKADSRTWLYRDIKTIGSAGPFSFRITTTAETYNFDLKERLLQAAYDFAWRHAYGLSDGRDSETAVRD